MQIKTKLRFHLNPVRITIISNTTNNRCWQGCKEKETPLHCWWECKPVQPLWKKIWRLLKKLNIDLPFDPAKKKKKKQGVLWFSDCWSVQHCISVDGS
jgi:hypothetical protein